MFPQFLVEEIIIVCENNGFGNNNNNVNNAYLHSYSRSMQKFGNSVSKLCSNISIKLEPGARF